MLNLECTFALTCVANQFQRQLKEFSGGRWADWDANVTGMEKKEKIKIIMDHREMNEILKQTLRSNPSVNLEISTLKTGDFLLNDLLLVERKTFHDMVASIKDGRIFQQACRLTSASEHHLIILEGTTQDTKSIRMKREAIQGAMICLSLKFRIPILRSISPEETGKLMIRAYQQLADGENHKRHLPPRPASFKRNTKFKQQMFILQGLPGVGPAKAKMLLDKFGTLKAIFSACVSDLKETDGVGKYTAEQIFAVLHEEIQPYRKKKSDQFFSEWYG
jgi:ERCC4-type nuclease